jgi:protein tyrosine phosphatase (PTP) superfamily phosphohydrolase (DUF442 family)
MAPRPRRRAATALIAGGVIAAALMLLWYMGIFGGNVRTVVQGRVYRSAQLDGAELGALLDREHIHTVVSLRGGSAADAAELDACQKRGVTHVEIPLSASAFPPPDRLRKLLDTFDTAQYPILFHCQGGADRSGLAGTLYLMLYEHVPLDEAERRELTWRYGHISWGAARAMDDFFNVYRLTNFDPATGQKIDIRRWIIERYPFIYDQFQQARSNPKDKAAAEAAERAGQ